MAQQASPKLAGHELRERAHLTSSSMRLVMTLCVSPASPSSRMSPISPTRYLLRRFLGAALAAVGPDASDRRRQRALGAHLAGVGSEITEALQRPPVEAAAGHLVDEREEEQHREDGDRHEPVDA